MPRIKIDMPSVFPFQTEIDIRITDINYGNHLGNDALLSIIHEARMRFLNSLGFSEKDVAGFGIIMGDVAIIYKSQAYYGDRLTCEVAVDNLSKKSCDFFYRLSKNENQVVALAKTAIVFYDYSAEKPTVIPPEFREKIENQN